MRIVVKIGGSLLDDEKAVKEICREVARLAEKNELVFVHGGGRQVNRVAEKLGVGQAWVGKPRPWRVTDGQTVEMLKMVIGGSINYHLCYLVGKSGGKPVGVNGSECDAVYAEKKEYAEWTEGRVKKRGWIGFTGLTKKINTQFFKFLLKNGFVPVVACLARGKNDECLNINGDELAGVIAGQLKCETLVLLTDVPGFLDEGGEPVKKMSVKEIRGMLAKGRVSGGMVAKLEACVQGWNAGARRIIMADGRVKNPIASALKGKGTVVMS